MWHFFCKDAIRNREKNGVVEWEVGSTILRMQTYVQLEFLSGTHVRTSGILNCTSLMNERPWAHAFCATVERERIQI